MTSKARSAKSPAKAAKTTRPIAIVGGNRIPFARSDKAYAKASNQDMFTAALDGLVSRFGLQGERLGMVVGGAVLKKVGEHSLIRESSPVAPACSRSSPSGTRSRWAGSSPASAAAPTPPPTRRSA